jgi:putative membrane protein
MGLAANIAVALVALIHAYILVLEMFLWTRPAGLRAFAMTVEYARSSAILAANQGLYNGFLAAGLFWGLLDPRPAVAFSVKVFFLLCVILAGLYGAWTARSRRILLVQAAPAAVALALLLSA